MINTSSIVSPLFLHCYSQVVTNFTFIRSVELFLLKCFRSFAAKKIIVRNVVPEPHELFLHVTEVRCSVGTNTCPYCTNFSTVPKGRTRNAQTLFGGQEDGEWETENN